jgi:excisionase family DNA binding protein
MAQPVTIERAMLNVSETARVLGLGLTSTRKAVHRGDIPSVRIARRILIPKAAIDQMLAGKGPNHPGSAGGTNAA